MYPERSHTAAAMALVAAAAGASAASLKDIKHIVLFMQENRAFDHYFGTMAGVRGFADPNVQVNGDGLSVFEQPVNPPKNGSSVLKPWHANYLGGDWVNATQCMGAGDNGWAAMHRAYNGGLGNNWLGSDGAWSMAYFNREDIPTHFDIAEGWTVLDMNTQSILAATDPNRIFWNSGSVNIPGSPTNPDGEGGVILDNTATPGCEAPKLNCYPFTWKTFQEYLEEAGISWQVWQDFDNFEDNALAYFEQYQTAANSSALREKGNSYPGLDAFVEAAASGTLPQVSYIVGPQELSEHPPNMPKDGAWLQKQIVDAVTSSPAYKETVLVISYDEQGGWADYVVPAVAENGTAGEWFEDPYGEFGYVPLGPGWRVPRYIISPYTRGGNVFTERTDHSSDIMFVEQWAAANGYEGVYSKELDQWRRDHMSNLVDALDFENPDFSIPSISEAPAPLRKDDKPSDYTGNFSLGSLTGPFVGPAKCLSEFSNPKPPVPYGEDNASQDLAQLVERGFKRVRGRLTEGRYLTFEMWGLALTNVGWDVVLALPASKDHDDVKQRWVVHAADGAYGNQFIVQSATDGKYMAKWPGLGSLTDEVQNAQVFTIEYTAEGATYSIGLGGQANSFVALQGVDGASRMFRRGNGLGISSGAEAGRFEVFSVSYH